MKLLVFRGNYVADWRLWGVWINRKWFIGVSRVATDREYLDWCADGAVNYLEVDPRAEGER